MQKFETEFINTFSLTANAEPWLGDVKYSVQLGNREPNWGKQSKLRGGAQTIQSMPNSHHRLGCI